MLYTEITCPRCRAPFPASMLNMPGRVACPSCLTATSIRVFPAFCRPVQAEVVPHPMLEGDSTCFYHAGKPAVIPCEACGRFLCSLCDLEMAGRHICAPCLEREKAGGKQKNLESRFVRYDELALSLSVLPVLLPFFWFFTILTAPAALFICIRFWKAPLGVWPHGKGRYIVAMILSLAQLAGWVFLASILYMKWIRR